ncbi:MAG: hypothetical protein WD278_18645 [Pirellulales bacterium]
MRTLVIALAIVCIAAVPRERTLQDHFDDLLGSMQLDDGSHESGRVRAKAYWEMRRAHERLLDQLIEIAGTEKAVDAQGDSRFYAVHLLALYRSRKAVPVFVKHVDWEYRVPGSGGLVSPIPNHPCAVALSAYGAEAVPEIYKRLQQAEPPPSDKAIELYAWIIVGALGGDEAVRAVETRAKRALGNKNVLLFFDKVKEVAEKRRLKPVNAEGGDLIPAPEAHTLQEHFDELLTTLQFDDGSLASERVRADAHRELGQAHFNLMSKLVEIVGTEKESYDRHRTDSRFLAVHLLGRMRYGEAVRAFVKHVDWEYKLPNGGSLPVSNYPCAVMLRSRGTVALHEIFNALEGDRVPSDKAIELYAWLVIDAYEYLGGDQEAIQLVEMRAKRAENNKNLLLLLDKVKEIVEQRTNAR